MVDGYLGACAFIDCLMIWISNFSSLPTADGFQSVLWHYVFDSVWSREIEVVNLSDLSRPALEVLGTKCINQLWWASINMMGIDRRHFSLCPHSVAAPYKLQYKLLTNLYQKTDLSTFGNIIILLEFQTKCAPNALTLTGQGTDLYCVSLLIGSLNDLNHFHTLIKWLLKSQLAKASSRPCRNHCLFLWRYDRLILICKIWIDKAQYIISRW